MSSFLLNALIGGAATLIGTLLGIAITFIIRLVLGYRNIGIALDANFIIAAAIGLPGGIILGTIIGTLVAYTRAPEHFNLLACLFGSLLSLGGFGVFWAWFKKRQP
jgi:hypothetical protein